jgi:hemolysin activation/secretion protein
MVDKLLKLLLLLAAMWPCMSASAASVQTPVDRADPSVVEEELRDGKEPARQPTPKPPLLLDPSESAETATLTRPFAVRMIQVEGASELAAATFRAAVAPFAGRTLDAGDMRALATAVADAARSAGYGLATAWIPEQTVAQGVLRVAIDEGRIDDIEIDGYAGAPVRRLLAPLANGRPVRTAELERRLLLAGDVPGVSMGQARLERVRDRNLLVVKVKRARTEGRVSADNWGSNTVGPVRAHLRVDLNGLLAEDDRVTIGGVTTPLQPKEFGLARLAYSKAVGSNGTEVTISGYAARSRPGGVLADREFEGRSLEASLGISHPIVRGRDASFWGDLELTLRDAEQSQRDTTIRNDRLSILRASGYLTAKLGGGRMRARLSLSQGIGILGATREDDPLRSRRDGSAIFSKAEFWASYHRGLGGPISIQFQAEGQVASRPLLSSEEMGLGGRYFLRGYDYREFSGDKGIAGSVEIRLDLPDMGSIETSQLYGFGDAGTVGNLEGGFGSGSLASAGGGVRAWLRHDLETALELGVPLSEGADGEERDPRVSFVVTKRF